MAHVNSSSFNDPDGIFLWTTKKKKDGTIERVSRIGGPYPSHEEADNASRIVSQMVGEAPVGDYQEFLERPVSTTNFEGRPQYTPPETISGTNLFGDLKKIGSSLLDFTPQSFSASLLDYRDMLGKPLVPVGKYRLEESSGTPRYEDTALLSHEAGEAFIKMNDAYKKDRGKGIPIESAFRDPEHNKKVKGSRTSKHMRGESVDISDPESFEWVKDNGEKFGWFFNPYDDESNHFEYEG